jgi:hypothetical protein
LFNSSFITGFSEITVPFLTIENKFPSDPTALLENVPGDITASDFYRASGCLSIESSNHVANHWLTIDPDEWVGISCSSVRAPSYNRYLIV